MASYLSHAVSNARSGANPDYYIGGYDVLERIVSKLPQHIIDIFEEKGENDG